ncbi:Dimethyladenosine transferase (S-adenosylmethionine-6-N',N'-adenosyl(rRNA) dimethyltransferase) (16S rRNA dimethylase) (High level kasugamycin resistance protein ksgA) [Candidatus Phytoplasma australiense]|uniref:Ribosomal RNA small subunit methyltransferase A n=1 Tax=Phytoplasma australiense TaxID=59748 RepID=RSMA_PHYAS|nr:RecName: Full=Ribosomal RNA small subunit methyltransferase A; AltName: Full=16S rRNA (adenine(1518)-N(6)/adenine(1519)-N(6))-dimethyltransferase; AltName: Full=16S rRNA dimethyladenosine transferase; AltName: Full=16S rRNA dimethylase; AltName: Full=S-adenosylmethionine-6-N', N'-adenosyl(rRNA) dimethyltransferase [Candidatus Phytoplasma australiense]CAM11607.1 Dimethyladenosine transferase (S-adenosylmethionine-6-N',N'-adenosyl(rRNA) dimethyltransferase) (16S rRNA dimethylase) (High level kasu
MQHQPKKKYGQNFLKDVNLLKKIVSKANLKGKNVIEIGPGKGSLTNLITKEANLLLAYEIDPTLKPFLVFDTTKIKIIYDDFLKRDLVKDFDNYFSINCQLSLISNLPYYITTTILFKIIQTPQIVDATLMMQKEVGMRLMAQPNSKNYNALSVITQYFFNIEKIQEVKSHMFFPQPKVDSVVLKLSKHKSDFNTFSTSSQKNFITFVKAAFKQKRKTLLNNLSSVFLLPKTEIILFFEQNKLLTKIRAEEITLKEFQKISIQWFLFQNKTKESQLNNYILKKV